MMCECEYNDCCATWTPIQYSIEISMNFAEEVKKCKRHYIVFEMDKINRFSQQTRQFVIR